jgi:hypothetical protein
VSIGVNSWQNLVNPVNLVKKYSIYQQNSCQFARIRDKKNRTSALPQPQFSKSIKSCFFPTTFNQNHTIFHQNHTKTILLFNTFRQNFLFFAFSRQRVFAIFSLHFHANSAHLRNPPFSKIAAPIQRTCLSRRSPDERHRDEDGHNPHPLNLIPINQDRIGA